MLKSVNNKLDKKGSRILNFFIITNLPDIAVFAVNSGVDLVFVDLEIIGKNERQGHLDTVISKHTIEDVERVRAVIPKGRLLVRINPIHEETEAEIEAVIKAGADILMLPMFRTSKEVAIFTRIVAGRARCCLLVETVAAVKNIQNCLKVPGVDQVHIGLNDLHLELGLDFMFQPLVNGILNELCQHIRDSGIPFGIGGVARVGQGMLPAELLLAEHVWQGSTWAILSRTFHDNASSVKMIQEKMDFPKEIAKLRYAYAELNSLSVDELQILHNDIQIKVDSIVSMIQQSKNLMANA